MTTSNKLTITLPELPYLIQIDKFNEYYSAKSIKNTSGSIGLFFVLLGFLQY